MTVWIIFDVAWLCIIELIAQFPVSRGNQVPASINKKLCVGDTVFLSQSVEERRSQKSYISDVRMRTPFSLTPRGQSRGGCRHKLRAVTSTLCQWRRRATVSSSQLRFVSHQLRPVTPTPSAGRSGNPTVFLSNSRLLGYSDRYPAILKQPQFHATTTHRRESNRETANVCQCSPVLPSVLIFCV